MKLLGVIVGCLVLLVVAAFVVVIQPGSSGVVASLRLADGSEYMVTQRCNWGPEPYTIAFYMRSPGGKWGWCYIDNVILDLSHRATPHNGPIPRYY